MESKPIGSHGIHHPNGPSKIKTSPDALAMLRNSDESEAIADAKIDDLNDWVAGIPNPGKMTRAFDGEKREVAKGKDTKGTRAVRSIFNNKSYLAMQNIHPYSR